MVLGALAFCGVAGDLEDLEGQGLDAFRAVLGLDSTDLGNQPGF